MKLGAFRFTKDDTGIGWIVIDTPGEKINKLSRSLFDEIAALIDQCGKDGDLEGIVLISGKDDNFIAGADIEDFLAFRGREDAESMSRRGQEILSRMEALPVPVVAAIHGACLGGGLETALACHYRVSSDSSQTVLGQPEVQLGLIPGGGATQRLPRLIGLGKALDLILSGRTIRPRAASRMGLVDEVAPRHALESAARQAVRDLRSGKRARRTLGWRQLAIDRNPAARALICRLARKRVLTRTRGLYPAPLRALECVRAGLARGSRAGYALETRFFGDLTVTETCRRLIGLFYEINSIKKDTGVDRADIRPRPVRNVAVIGGGFMGSGIAAASALAGLRIRIKESNYEALGAGLRFCHDFFSQRRKRGRITRLESEQMLARCSGTLDYSGFGLADLVIEAVFEDLELKRRVLREAEGHMRAGAVYGSNTSSIPISRIQEASRHPENVLGLHFFSPVARMPLLEIVVTPRTAPEATATAVAFAKKVGKTHIVVCDGAGFYTSRILAPYMNEASHLLLEGASIESIDGAMLQFGYPVGPLALLDEVGIDVAHKVALVMETAYGPRMKAPAASGSLLEHGRKGRKSGLGFYRYEGRRKKADRGVYACLGPDARPKLRVEEGEIQQRLALAMINEAVLCLQEGVLRSPRDGDVGAVLGLGFPPFLGGPFRYLDSLGASRALTDLERLSERFAPRFQPASLLAEMARHGRKFHP